MQHLLDEGWSEISDEGFIGLVGPFYSKTEGGDFLFRFPTDARHRNRRGVVQGGALITFADRCMGIVGRTAAGCEFSATVQMDVHFTGATQVGDTVEMRARVVRMTGQLIFMNADLTSGGEVVLSVNGIWKKLNASSAVARLDTR